MKKIILCSLLSIAGFLSGQPEVDMSRIYAEEAQAKKDFDANTIVEKKAFEALYKTEKGKIYKQELDKKKLTNHSSPEFLQASADLRATEAYQNEFLPVEKDVKYHDYKLFGLQKMIRYVEARRSWSEEMGRHDIKAMNSGLHSALYVDAGPNLDLRATRDQVYCELADMIKLEDRILSIEEAKFTMPEYQ